MDKVRVRFAPSPTGALHIGGVRTALFNYLFAKKHSGTFVLRIEDTDQARFVEGAEEYIKQSLAWCGLEPDESPWNEGDFTPYRQSERKDIYQKYGQQLLDSGNAYYAFDTPEELDEMREKLKATKAVNQQYNAVTRLTMKNSLTLSEDEVKERLDSGEPYVVRLKINPKEEVRLKDEIRGWVKVSASTLDDKVIMKSDGLPTYHLANVVDDYLMKITHVIRGEEWLPSAPTHVLLYKALGWEKEMPSFAHLPLILKPDGNGKLSKRAADKLGFPIFPLNWTDPETQELSQGFMEAGFKSEALVNFLAFLGWNPGSDREIYSLDELSEAFSLENVNKAGTKFDLDKLRWFNEQYLRAESDEQIGARILPQLAEKYEAEVSQDLATSIAGLFKERVTFEQEIIDQSFFFFEDPKSFDEKVIRKKLNDDSVKAMNHFAETLLNQSAMNASEIKELYSETLNAIGTNPGSVMQLLRVLISGQPGGPDLMEIISLLGPEKAGSRIKHSLQLVQSN